MKFVALLLLCVTVHSVECSSFTFNESISYDYLYYAYGAYCGQSAIASMTCNWCDEFAGFVPTAFANGQEAASFAFVGYNPTTEMIMVSFRGTLDNSTRNWIVDFLFPETTVWKGQNASIRVHTGFYDTYKGLAYQIVPAVQQLVTTYPNYTVGVTGHSLGAALATLCALDLVESQFVPFHKMQVYHFGSPRVGNLGFADYYKEVVPHTFRLVNDRDIVPSMPPQFLDFHHVPTEVWEHGSTYKQCNGSGEDPTCSDSVLSFSGADHTDYMQVETCECAISCMS